MPALSFRTGRRFAVAGALTSLAFTAAGAGLPATATATTKSGTVTLVASGLDNPRSLAFGANGHLYVADAGRGGTECPAGFTGPDGGQECAGFTGAIVRVANGQHEPELSGLVSLASANGTAAVGVSGLVAQDFGLLGLMNVSSQQVPDSFSRLLHAEMVKTLGRLFKIDLPHANRGAMYGAVYLADPGAADWRWTSSHQYKAPDDFPDANPYFVTLGPDGTALTVDAGSNTIDTVKRGVSTPIHYIPNYGTGDAVPTCLTVGPDGALYVGTLGAGGNAAGTARVYRIVPGLTQVWRTGFTTITGCGFDRAGNFYATELQTAGLNPSPSGNPKGGVVKVSKDGRTRTMLGVNSLFFPQGFALAPDGASIYVSNWSIMPGRPTHTGGPTGSVVKITL